MKQGFTTVELMITLFVAGIFILAGYQLYSVVLANSVETRYMGEASNIGYEVLRDDGGTYVATTNSCSSPSTSVVNKPNSLPAPTTITLNRCRPFTDSSIIKVTVTVTYGPHNQEVSHATYLGSE